MGMRTVHLLRHAKSSWAQAGTADFDRPLAPRGEQAALRIAAHLRANAITPDLVLCSSARRTQRTLALVRTVWPDDTEVLVEEGLYGATASELIERLRSLNDDVTSVVVIGHNPGLHDLALRLAGSGDEALIDDLSTNLPTGALATLTVDGAWKALDRGTARLAGFVVPRNLPPID